MITWSQQDTSERWTIMTPNLTVSWHRWIKSSLHTTHRSSPVEYFIDSNQFIADNMMWLLAADIYLLVRYSQAPMQMLHSKSLAQICLDLIYKYSDKIPPLGFFFFLFGWCMSARHVLENRSSSRLCSAHSIWPNFEVELRWKRRESNFCRLCPEMFCTKSGDNCSKFVDLDSRSRHKWLLLF